MGKRLRWVILSTHVRSRATTLTRATLVRQWYVDKWTFALEAICYAVAIPVIFATQSGYVPLFSTDSLENSALD